MLHNIHQASELLCIQATVDDRKVLLELNGKEVKLSGEVDLANIAEMLEGYSGADITDLFRYIVC